jgi:hypothetical protein
MAAGFATHVQAQAPAPLEKQLEAQYSLTTPTADNTALVTTGSVLILQKKGLSAGLASNKVPTQNTYKDGQIKAGAATALRRFGSLPGIGYVPGVGATAAAAAGAAGAARDFVNGEKLFVTKIDIDRSKDALVFFLISDAYDAGRYTASLKIELPKGSIAKGDLAVLQPVLDQVFKIAPPDDQAAAAPQGGATQPASSSVQPPAPSPAPVAAAPPPPPLPDIPPPPPPPADPAAIKVGQTIDQVVSAMGQPKSIVDLGAKKIYVYDGIKVTFVSGKMTTAE